MRLGIVIAVVVAVALAPRHAWGDERAMSSYGEHRHRAKSSLGVTVAAGGGVARFTSADMRASLTSELCASWDLRLTLGSRTRFGLDAAIGATTASVHTLTDRAPLVGMSDEVAVRVNALPDAEVNPYAFAGVGWQRFNVVRGSDEMPAGMHEGDTAVAFPVGAGVTYRDPGGPVLDLRATYRATAFENLVGTNAGYASMHSWSATAAVGYEF